MVNLYGIYGINHWYLWLIYGESMVDVLNYGVELMLMYHIHDI